METRINHLLDKAAFGRLYLCKTDGKDEYGNIPFSTIQRSSGYAIDPGYADKLIKIIEQYNLADFDVVSGKEVRNMNITNVNAQVSWHYTVDDTETYQHLPQLFNGNRFSQRIKAEIAEKIGISQWAISKRLTKIKNILKSC